MSNLFENESEFNGLNLLIYQISQISSKPTTESTRFDRYYHDFTPKPTTESTRMGENDQNTTSKPATSKGPHEEKSIGQLAKILKGLISQAVAEVKLKSQEFIELQAASNEVVRAMPISYHIPENDPSVLIMSEQRRKKTIVVGEIQTSFDIPEEYILYVFERNKIKLRVKHDVGLKFLERLKEWKLQCRQRADGKLDVYFHHLKSNEFFRSNIEVVKYILFEICPRHLKRATKTANENFSGSNAGGGGVPKRSWTSSRSTSSRGKSMKKQYSPTEIGEVEEKAINGVMDNDSMNKLDNGNIPQTLKTYNDKHMNSVGASTASKEATIEDVFHLENTEGTKRKRTEDSSSRTSTRMEKCIALSPNLVTADAVSDANVEVQDQMVSASEPDQLVKTPKPSQNQYQYDLATHMVNLKYRRLGDDDFF